MNVVCAWCGRMMEETGSAQPISHGICESCAGEVTSRTGMSLKQYLDSLDLPVLAVDSDGAVKVASEKALALLGKTESAVAGRLGGEVFECAYARLPGGCGRTTHCSGCAIRRTVTDTFQTGRARLRVPATLEYDGQDGQKTIALHLSTEKVGDVVLLRIDRMGAGQDR